MVDLAELAGGDALPGLQAQAGRSGRCSRRRRRRQRAAQRDQFGRLGAGHRQRLLADDVLAGGQRLPALLEVEAVRRGEVDDADRGVGEQLLEGWRRRGRVPRLAGGVAALLGRRAEDADDGPAEPAQGLDVDGADEAGADEGGASACDRFRGMLICSRTLTPGAYAPGSP